MASLSCPPTKPPKMLFFRAPADAEDAPMEAKIIFFRGGPPSGSSSWGPPQRAMNEARRWPLGRLLPIAHDRTLQRNTPTATRWPARRVRACSLWDVQEHVSAWHDLCGRIGSCVGANCGDFASRARHFAPKPNERGPHGARSGVGVMCRDTCLSGCQSVSVTSRSPINQLSITYLSC